MLIVGMAAWAALVILIAGVCRVAAVGERAARGQRLESARVPLAPLTRAHEANSPKNVKATMSPKELRRSCGRRRLLTGVAARRSLSS
jgi:hypothetical protein